ncbi:hypothetical protein D9758_015345 [Tetrapyrgos nigripes]|uniref:Uncharacterized protein n=1 Tax=Tetrapyrgos nigripes TaxID=182062 RepID=A0A8H5FNX8_9AGAR|nr:hypothetical protein D9758_015345 [Tetrapyrgos nigripes]
MQAKLQVQRAVALLRDSLKTVTTTQPMPVWMQVVKPDVPVHMTVSHPLRISQATLISPEPFASARLKMEIIQRNDLGFDTEVVAVTSYLGAFILHHSGKLVGLTYA